MTEQLEGWCSDPYGRHEARWLSDGHPTKLVRDGDAETYDEPPDEAPSVVTHPIQGAVPDGDDDLRRADGAQTGAGYDRKKAFRGIMDVIDQVTPGGF